MFFYQVPMSSFWSSAFSKLIACIILKNWFYQGLLEPSLQVLRLGGNPLRRYLPPALTFSCFSQNREPFYNHLDSINRFCLLLNNYNCVWGLTNFQMGKDKQKRSPSSIFLKLFLLSSNKLDGASILLCHQFNYAIVCLAILALC